MQCVRQQFQSKKTKFILICSHHSYFNKQISETTPVELKFSDLYDVISEIDQVFLHHVSSKLKKLKDTIIIDKVQAEEDKQIWIRNLQDMSYLRNSSIFNSIQKYINLFLYSYKNNMIFRSKFDQFYKADIIQSTNETPSLLFGQKRFGKQKNISPFNPTSINLQEMFKDKRNNSTKPQKRDISDDPKIIIANLCKTGFGLKDGVQSQAFRKTFGQSSFSYLNNRKISSAHQQIRSQDNIQENFKVSSSSMSKYDKKQEFHTKIINLNINYPETENTIHDRQSQIKMTTDHDEENTLNANTRQKKNSGDNFRQGLTCLLGHSQFSDIQLRKTQLFSSSSSSKVIQNKCNILPTDTNIQQNYPVRISIHSSCAENTPFTRDLEDGGEESMPQKIHPSSKKSDFIEGGVKPFQGPQYICSSSKTLLKEGNEFMEGEAKLVGEPQYQRSSLNNFLKGGYEFMEGGTKSVGERQYPDSSLKTLVKGGNEFMEGGAKSAGEPQYQCSETKTFQKQWKQFMEGGAKSFGEPQYKCSNSKTFQKEGNQFMEGGAKSAGEPQFQRSSLKTLVKGGNNQLEIGYTPNKKTQSADKFSNQVKRNREKGLYQTSNIFSVILSGNEQQQVQNKTNVLDKFPSKQHKLQRNPNTRTNNSYYNQLYEKAHYHRNVKQSASLKNLCPLPNQNVQPKKISLSSLIELYVGNNPISSQKLVSFQGKIQKQNTSHYNDNHMIQPFQNINNGKSIQADFINSKSSYSLNKIDTKTENSTIISSTQRRIILKQKIETNESNQSQNVDQFNLNIKQRQK